MIKNNSKAPSCTCPSGDGSLRHPCPAHPAAERPELWAVHAQGPDELYAAFTRADAEKHAAELNCLPVPVSVSAVVIPSPWPAAEHWQYLAEQERDHKNEIAVRLRQLERICEGLPQDAIDGGWTAQGIRAHSKQLEEQLKVAQAEVEALRAENAKLSEALDRWPPIRDILKLRLADAQARVAKLEHSQSFQRDIDYSVLSEYADKHRLHFNNLCAVVRSALIALPAQAQHSVPEGWKLVPLEPNEDLLHAIHNYGYVGPDEDLRYFYKAVLSVAPAPSDTGEEPIHE